MDAIIQVPRNSPAKPICQSGTLRKRPEALRGLRIIGDDTWKVKGEWDDGKGEFNRASVRHSPSDYQMTVSIAGDTTLSEV
ncbi:hypothetical protein ACFTZK_35840 [Streptomyces decoyicus]|uniref:hypothetical protein n=1 Tax=Streptomyces decoyicus TaxID=249567 RepID=UPI00363A98FF